MVILYAMKYPGRVNRIVQIGPPQPNAAAGRSEGCLQRILGAGADDHGREPRGRWVLGLPKARLLSVENAAHVPWIEAQEKVFGGIETFLDGAWPDAAELVETLDPAAGGVIA
jgi:hypothetical protein